MVPNAEHEELLGDGYLAIVRAVDRYDAAQGIPLEGFAAKVIIGAMLNALRRRDPVGERARRVLRAVERERFVLAVAEGAMPNERVLEERFPLYRSSAAEVARRNPLSLDNPLPIGRRIPVDWGGDPAMAVVYRDRVRRLYRELGSLSLRQYDLIVRYYLRGETLTTVGAEMGITRQRASQLHVRALQRLKRRNVCYASA